MCPMGCLEEDTHEHAMLGVAINPIISRNQNIVYEDIFSEDINIQAAVSHPAGEEGGCHAEDIGPSNCSGAPGQCVDSDICTHCILMSDLWD